MQPNFIKLNDNFIAYKQYKSKVNSSTVIFHHGLKSDMEGKKSLFLHNLCKDLDINFIRFDNFGHGNSSGSFFEETIGSWIEGLNAVIDNLCQGNIILVGSSMGAWVSLAVSTKYLARLKGLLLLAPAPDFTEILIWDKLSNEQQNKFRNEGSLSIGTGEYQYKISYNLIEEARKHFIFNRPLEIKCPVQIIQGKQDKDVPFEISLKLAEQLISPRIDLKLLDQSDHRLSNDYELAVIAESLKNLLN